LKNTGKKPDITVVAKAELAQSYMAQPQTAFLLVSWQGCSLDRWCSFFLVKRVAQPYPCRTGEWPAPLFFEWDFSDKNDNDALRLPASFQNGDFDTHFKVFHELMSNKVFEILLVASPYDAYILEEDGSLASKIINEYQG
jgi:hypothetical protein